MKTEQTKFANTKVRITHFTSGPRHDPYGGEDIAVTRYGVRHLLTMCGLRGLRYARYDEHSIRPTYKTEWDFEGDAVAKEFAEATGADIDQWHRWYYEKIYQPDPMGCLADYE